MKILALLCIAALVVGSSAARELYITPTTSAACPASPCYTIKQVISSPSEYFTSDTVLLFPSDAYEISEDAQVAVRDVSNLALKGSSKGTTTFHCMASFGLTFADVTNLTVSLLRFESCGAKLEGTFMQEAEVLLAIASIQLNRSMSVVLGFKQVAALSVSQVSVQMQNGYGFWGINLMGNSTISGSRFTHSSGAGNFVLYFTDSWMINTQSSSHLIIHSSEFTNGFTAAESTSLLGGGGLSLLLFQTSYGVHVSIANVTTSNNSAVQGANMYLHGTCLAENSVQISDTNSTNGRGNIGTGLLFLLNTDSCPSSGTQYHTLAIQGSNFFQNEAYEGSVIEVSTLLNDVLVFSIRVTLKNCSIISNRVFSGSESNRTAVFHLNATGNASFQNVTFSHNVHSITGRHNGSQVLAETNPLPILRLVTNVPQGTYDQLQLDCRNCNFSYNNGSVVTATYTTKIIKQLWFFSELYFTGVTIFHKNYAGSGAIVTCSLCSVHIQSMSSFTQNHADRVIFASISSVNITGNSLFKENKGTAVSVGGGLSLSGHTSFIDNGGEVNVGGAISMWNLDPHSAAYSTIYIQGNATLDGNTARFGGAIALTSAIIHLKPPVHIRFSDNMAHYGGAVYTTAAAASDNLCFLQVENLVGDLRNDSLLNVSVSFINNAAVIAGSAVFGGSFDQCILNAFVQYPPAANYYNSIFHVKVNDSDLSAISSLPYRVCICEDDKPNCDILDVYNVTRYPGQTLPVQLIAVGQAYGAVPATVTAELADGSSALRDLEYRQMIADVSSCTTLNYSILSQTQTELLVLGVENLVDPDISLVYKEFFQDSNAQSNTFIQWHHPVSIHISLLQCPVGFQLTKEKSAECICAPSLIKLGIGCSIDTQTIQRPQHAWIGDVYYDNGTHDAVVHFQCPYDYCDPDRTNLNLIDPDEQCQHNHSGFLCGACKSNLSLALGSSQCLRCSNLYLMLLVPFALAGIALVVFLKSFNLTVSFGAVNGLIFYANIVRANQEVFFPSEAGNTFLSLLSIFIAWLNLDLGFQTCFWNGLDAFGKTWLQFVFPAFIWTIMSTIIILSHYYIIAAKLSGRNAVPVLATLFLLSYAKLLRVVITALSFTFLNFPDGSTSVVWLYDANVFYLRGKHIPLFITALLVLFLLSLPYTMMLLFAQSLKKSRWIMRKSKPLFDAYTGPYKDRHQYWGGLLLAVRAILFLTFSLNSLGDPALNLLAIASTVLAITLLEVGIGGAYKNIQLTLLEHFFLLNLGILSVATLYTRMRNGNQIALTCTSVAITLIAFMSIAVYHAVTAVKDSRCWKQFKRDDSRLNPPTNVPGVEPDTESDEDHCNPTRMELIWDRSNEDAPEAVLIPRDSSM